MEKIYCLIYGGERKPFRNTKIRFKLEIKKYHISTDNEVEFV